MKATRFDVIAHTADGYTSNVLRGNDVVVYRTSTKGGQYRPAKYAEGKPVCHSIHDDRVEITIDSEEDERVNVALSRDLILRLAESIKKQDA